MSLSSSKAISIGMIMGVDVGNVNAGWAEGVVTIIKKVERPDGYFHPYISGQALRRYIRDTMKDILKDREKNNGLKMSPEEPGIDKKAPVVTRGDPREFIDDDLFGFMKAIKKTRKKKGEEKSESKEDVDAVNIAEDISSEETQAVPEAETEAGAEVTKGTKKRTSPLRVSPAFGMFKLNSDRDLGTRSAIEVTKSADAGGSIFETEITHNLFRSSILLELDRVGVWKGYETTNPKDKEGGQLEDESLRKERIAILLESLKYLWGGGRQSRFLVNLTPNFIIYARMRKVPIFLNSLDVDYTAADGSNGTNLNYRIKTEIIKETIEDYTNDIQSLIIGIKSGRFSNTNSDFEKLQNNVKIMTVGSAIGSMINDIQTSKLA